MALHDKREYDAVVASGEQVTAGLTAIALQALGIKARSWQGWQIPIENERCSRFCAHHHIPGEKLRASLDAGEVAVITGFQGVEPKTGRYFDARPRRFPTRVRSPSPWRSTADVCGHLHGRRWRLHKPIRASCPRPAACIRSPTGVCAGNGVVGFEGAAERGRGRARARHGAPYEDARAVELRCARQMKPFKPDELENIGTIVCDEDEIVEQQVVSASPMPRTKPSSPCSRWRTS